MAASRRVRGICSVEGCGRPHDARGYCNRHYVRFMRYGDAGAHPDRRRTGPTPRTLTPRDPICTVEGCGKKHVGLGFCSMHYDRHRTGVPLDYEKPKTYRYVTSKGYIDLNIGGKTFFEHRVVMEAHIGRPLLRHENIHHKNGDRADNRIENLEIWNTSQPMGQRVPDKVAWAIELLELYAPDVLAGRPTQLRLVAS